MERSIIRKTHALKSAVCRSEWDGSILWCYALFLVESSVAVSNEQYVLKSANQTVGPKLGCHVLRLDVIVITIIIIIIIISAMSHRMAMLAFVIFKFVTIHSRDRQTDRQTDGQTDRITTPKTALAYACAVKTGVHNSNMTSHYKPEAKYNRNWHAQWKSPRAALNC